MKHVCHLFPALAALLVGAVASSAGITPVRIEKTIEPQFPTALVFSTLTAGEARVVISVDAAGHLTDLLVTGYTDPAFADEAVRVLRQWTYLPATKDGERIAVRLELSFDFSAPGRVVSMSGLDTIEVLTRTIAPRTLVSRVCQASELDRPLATIQTVAPVHPGKSRQVSTQTGSTVLDFYVDEQGQARMPVVVKATQDAFAEAAVDALSQWRFAAPTRHGRPVAVRVQQEFVFPGDS